MKRKIKANLYAGVDVSAIVVILSMIVLFCLFYAKKVDVKQFFVIGGYIVVIPFAIGATQAIFGKAKVTNKSGKPIYVKPEDGSEPLVVKPRTEQYDIDGVKVNGKVYKATDGTHIVVNADGTVTTKSLTGKFLNKFGGGYLSAPPDNGRKPLFNTDETA